jgi:hypothetical protein
MSKPLACAALLFLCQTPLVHAASAHATAAIDWSTVNIQIIDLDPTDGVTPTLTWSSMSSDLTDSATSYSVGLTEGTNHSRTRLTAVDTVTSASNTFAASANASLDHLSIQLDAFAEESAEPRSSYESNHSAASGVIRGSFSLSGKGVALIDLPYSLAVMGEQGNTGDYARAYLNISSSFSDSAGAYSGSTSTYKSYYSYSSGNYDVNDVFTLTLGNTDASTTVTGSIYANLNTYAYARSANSTVPSVPEAPGYAMMLAGLGLVATMVRKRGDDRSTAG